VNHTVLKELKLVYKNDFRLTGGRRTMRGMRRLRKRNEWDQYY